MEDGEFVKQFNDLGYFDVNSDGFKDFMKVIDEAKKEFPKCEDCPYSENNYRVGIELPTVEKDDGCTRNLKGLREDCPKQKWFEKWFGLS